MKMRKYIPIIICLFFLLSIASISLAAIATPKYLGGSQYNTYLPGYPSATVSYNMRLNWSKSTGLADTRANYTLLYFKEGSDFQTRGAGTLLSNTTLLMYNHTGLKANVEYYYRVWAYNESQNAYSTANYSFDITIEGDNRLSDIENLDPMVVTGIGVIMIVLIFGFIIALYGMMASGKFKTDDFIKVTIAFIILLTLLGIIAMAI